MNVLIYENPLEHKTSWVNFWKEFFTELGHDADSAASRMSLLLKLKKEKFDLCFIHHSGFEDIELIKREHPNLKCVAFTGALYSKGKDTAFIEKIESRYDYSIYPFEDYVECIDFIAEDLSKK